MSSRPHTVRAALSGLAFRFSRPRRPGVETRMAERHMSAMVGSKRRKVKPLPRQQQGTAPVRIDIFSDTVCPWCMIGKRRLERALAQRPGLNPAMRWRAFQLNPNMPDDGMDRRLYLELKFGGAQAARQIYDPIIKAGTQEGIPFDFEAIRRTPNTL